jgi:hypothetical protein
MRFPERWLDILPDRVREVVDRPKNDVDRIRRIAVNAARIWFDGRDSKSMRYYKAGREMAERLTLELIEDPELRAWELFLKMRVVQLLSTRVPKVDAMAEFLKSEEHKKICCFLETIISSAQDEPSKKALMKHIRRESEMPRYYIDIIFGPDPDEAKKEPPKTLKKPVP